MKKFVFILSLIFVVTCLFSSVPAFSADTEFNVSDGVLLSYTGSDTAVTIPSSVNVISDKAFYNNTKIKSVKLHKNVYSVMDEAFKGCTSLETVSGADGVNYVGAFAFADTKFLTQSNSEFLSLGSALISYNGKSSAVVLPDYIKTISPYAFLRNKNIVSFSAGDNLSSIDEGAFYECTSLKNIEVTGNLSFIGADAFTKTAWLDSKSGFVTLGNSILVLYKGSASDVVIPDNINSIAPNAFYDNKSITSLEIPSSVFSVGARAFSKCSNLKEVEFNNGLIMIDDEAFAQCSKLLEIKTPTTLKSIGKGAFIKCSSLTKAALKGDSLSVSYGAFSYCDSLYNVFLSKDVSSVGEFSFAENSNLRYVTIPQDVIGVYKNSFSGAKNVTIICDKGSFADSALSSFCSLSYKNGDCDRDSVVSVMDATDIQMYIAKIKTLSNTNLAFCDADNDAEISVMDATHIQLKLAKII